MSRKYSPYFYELEETEKLRYTQKLDKLGEIDDPFVQANVACEDCMECWPLKCGIYNNNKNFQSNETTESQHLHRAQLVTTLSITLISCVSEHIIEIIGNVDCKMVYFCLT